MARFKVELEYEGTRYSGWQVQKDKRTIQGELWKASQKVFKTEDFELYGAGRTDAGVHALYQVAHLDVKTMLAPEIIKMKINELLPPDINILEVSKANPNFHARFDAVARSYIYQISRRRTAFAKPHVWWIKEKLNLDQMYRTARIFEGFKDFRSFSDDTPEEKSTQVELIHVDIYENGDLITIHLIGSHFLWKMVRRLVGVMVEVGRNKMDLAKVQSFFETPSNEPARFTAPPSGLFLERIYYDKDEIEQNFYSFLGEL